MKHFRTGLMLGAMALLIGTGAGVSAQGVRIDQMPGAYNHDEDQRPHVRPDGTVGGNIYLPWNDDPDSTSCGLEQRPSVVAVPAKGTIIESDTPGARAPNPASHAPDPQEIACVYARASAANSNGAFNWIGGNTVVSVQPLLNLEMARYEFRITPSSVRCVKTKTPGHRCNYTITMVAVKGQGMSGMTAAFSGRVRPTVVTRADQFERSASGLASSSLNRAWASAPRTTTTSADDRRKWDEERQKAEEERERQARATDESMRQTYEMIYAK